MRSLISRTDISRTGVSQSDGSHISGLGIRRIAASALVAAASIGFSLSALAPVAAQSALNAEGGFIDRFDPVSRLSVSAWSSPSVARVATRRAAGIAAPTVTVTPAATASSVLNGFSVTAPSITRSEIRSTAIGVGSSASITGLSLTGIDRIGGVGVAARSYGAGASSVLSGVTVSAPSVTGVSLGAYATGPGASATISGVTIRGGSGNSISAVAVGNSVRNVVR